MLQIKCDSEDLSVVWSDHVLGYFVSNRVAVIIYIEQYIIMLYNHYDNVVNTNMTNTNRTKSIIIMIQIDTKCKSASFQSNNEIYKNITKM